MIYLKGNKEKLIKEYKNFATDMNLINCLAGYEWFAREYINNEVKINGIFGNENFKTTDINSIHNEIVKILRTNIKARGGKK